MPEIEFEGQNLLIDGDGFLQNPELWDEKIAQHFADLDGTGALTEKHWIIINFIREHWKKTDMAPMVRKICKHSGLRLREIYSLFPLGPAKGACKLAGLPKPEGCV